MFLLAFAKQWASQGCCTKAELPSPIRQLPKLLRRKHVRLHASMGRTHAHANRYRSPVAALVSQTCRKKPGSLRAIACCLKRPGYAERGDETCCLGEGYANHKAVLSRHP